MRKCGCPLSYGLGPCGHEWRHIIVTAISSGVLFFLAIWGVAELCIREGWHL